MTEKQSICGKNSRWIIKERYFGKFESERTICACPSLTEAKMIIDALLASHKGRCIEYKAEKIADDYNEIYDAIFEIDILTGETINNIIYLDGITCL